LFVEDSAFAGSSTSRHGTLPLMLAYLRRHHIGLLALFIALGGTSYTTVTPPAGTAILGSAGVTLEHAGKVLVLVTGTFGVNCSGSCAREIGATAVNTQDPTDKTQVPGAFATIVDTGTAQIDTASIVSLPAGTYDVRITNRMSSGTANTTSNGGNVRVVAVALG
jgi:hypothetical protein